MALEVRSNTRHSAFCLAFAQEEHSTSSGLLWLYPVCAVAMASALAMMALFHGPMIPCQSELKRQWLPAGAERAWALRFISVGGPYKPSPSYARQSSHLNSSVSTCVCVSVPQESSPLLQLLSHRGCVRELVGEELRMCSAGRHCCFPPSGNS